MKKNSVIVFYGLVGLFLVSLAFFVLSFLYSSFENISVMGFKSRLDEYNRKEKEFVKLEATYTEWKNMDKVYAQFKDDYLVKFNDYPNFRNELQSVLMGNAIRLVDMKQKYRNMMTDLRRVTIDLQLVGSYTNLKKFIFEMENKNSMVIFKELQLSKRDAVNIYAKISMEVYFVL